MKQTGLPVCASMCIGPPGDAKGISVEECAIRMAKAGADVIGEGWGLGQNKGGAYFENLFVFRRLAVTLCNCVIINISYNEKRRQKVSYISWSFLYYRFQVYPKIFLPFLFFVSNARCSVFHSRLQWTKQCFHLNSGKIWHKFVLSFLRKT